MIIWYAILFVIVYGVCYVGFNAAFDNHNEYVPVIASIIAAYVCYAASGMF